MRTIIILFLLTTTTAVSIHTQAQQNHCRISGIVKDTTVRYILLQKVGQDLRHDDILKIPVEQGCFQHEITFEKPEAITLYTNHIIDKSAGRYSDLFFEAGNIRITIFTQDQFDDNIIEGGPLNQEYQKLQKELKSKYITPMNAIQDSMEVLYAADKLLSDSMKELIKKFNENPSGEEELLLFNIRDSLRNHDLDMTAEGKALDKRGKGLLNSLLKDRISYMKNNSSIVAYKLFLDDILYSRQTDKKIDIDEVKENYFRLSKAHSGHPYNIYAHDLIAAIDNIRIGHKFVDFTAPDIQGNIFRLSELIKGKIALINLWATWCGPCITKSKTMLPLYAAYKDKGFTIIGVAGEHKNTDNLVKFLEREKWPWINLVDLDKKEKIWQKYSADHKAGAFFLIDRKGSIVAIDPNADEIKAILEKRLN